MVTTLYTGTNETVQSADWGYDNRNSTLFTKARYTTSQMRAEAVAQGAVFSPREVAVAAVGETVELGDDPSSSDDLEIRISGNYNGLLRVLGSASGTLSFGLFVKRASVSPSNTIDSQYLVDVSKNLGWNQRYDSTFTDELLYLPGEEMSQGDRFHVGVAVETKFDALTLGGGVSDAFYSTSTAEYIEYSEIEFSWS